MNTTLDLTNVTAVVEPTTAPVTVIETHVIETNNAPDLEQLVKQILELQSENIIDESLSKKHGKLLLERNIKQGGLLLECQKEVECKHPKGWGKWIAKHITSIEYGTVTRYIRLWEYGNISHETYSKLMECESTREAYYLVGIFKSKPSKKVTETQPTEATPTKDGEPSAQPEEPEPIVEMPFDSVKRLEHKLRTVFIENPTIGYYGEMITMLKPLVKIYNEYMEEHPEEPNRFN
jgi:hypothetical protein